MGRFDDLLTNTFTPPRVNPFDDLPIAGSRFGDLIQSVEKPTGAFKKTLKSFGGAVGAFGKMLSIPQRATTGFIEKGLEKVGVLESKTEGLGIKAGIKEEKSNVELLKRIGRETGMGGLLTGQYTPTTSWAGNFVRELPVTITGTLADIFVDPLFIVSKPGLVAKGTRETGKLLEKGFAVIADEVPAVQKIGNILGRAFLTRFGQREEFKSLDITRKVEESLLEGEVKKLVSPIIEKPAVIQQRITQIIKGGITSDDELKSLAVPIREELDRVGESISKLNPKLLSEETFAANKGTYFPRLYTDYEFPTAEKTVEHIFGSRTVSIPKEPFAKRILTETESLAKGTRIEEAGFPALKRLIQLGVTEQRQNFFKEVSKLASTESRPGWIQLSDDKGLGDLAGKFLPAVEYSAIAAIRHIPSELERKYNTALMIWKTFKTAYNPATISRNALTNFFILNPIGGVGPHRLDIYARTVNEMKTKGALYQLARKEGLEITTQQSAELTPKATRFYRENTGLVKQFFGKLQDYHNAVRNFYGSQDKFFKLANFIKGVQEDGLTPFQAMKRAQFYLVNYSEVPKFIEWLRNQPFGVPFISFTYGVSKPLAKTLLERPDKLAAYFKILNGIQQMNPMGETKIEREKELDVAPDWIQSGTFLRLPFRDKFGRGQYVDLQYILPFNILETRSILPSNPLLNTTAAILTNRDIFTGKELTKKTDTTKEKAEKYMTTLVSQLLPSFTPFIGTSYNKLVNALRQRPDRNGFVKTKLEVFLDIISGIKITPIDPTIEAQKRASEKQGELQDLHSELKKIMLDKSLFPEEKEKESQKVIEKIRKVKVGQ